MLCANYIGTRNIAACKFYSQRLEICTAHLEDCAQASSLDAEVETSETKTETLTNIRLGVHARRLIIKSLETVSRPRPGLETYNTSHHCANTSPLNHRLNHFSIKQYVVYKRKEAAIRAISRC